MNFNKIKSHLIRYINIPIYSTIFISIIIMSRIIYHRYQNRIDLEALKDLLDDIISFNKVKSPNQINENSFNAIYSTFDISSDKYKNSNLYPYFLVYKSEILSKQNKKIEALENLEKAINYLKNDNIIYFSYSIKAALLKIDSKNEDYINQGLNDLKKLSQDKINDLQDMSKYYYGLALWSLNKKDEAKNVWRSIPLIKGQSKWHEKIKEITEI